MNEFETSQTSFQEWKFWQILKSRRSRQSTIRKYSSILVKFALGEIHLWMLLHEFLQHILFLLFFTVGKIISFYNLKLEIVNL
jgi:hypothetical protein